MYDFIRKFDFFDWWDAGYADKAARNLKSIQDAWVLSELHSCEGLRIGEVGGGDSRLLRQLADKNACVNIDKFEGAGLGPQKVVEIPGVDVARAYMGDFDEVLADESFDVLFSVSVIEHVIDDRVSACFADMARILKPGGRMLHAIDVYLYDEWSLMPAELAGRIGLYRECAMGSGLRWECDPVIGDEVSFRCDIASNSDQQIAYSCKLVPELREQKAAAQNCSIKMILVKD
jgi:SAM-dependent methyltransferase